MHKRAEEVLVTQALSGSQQAFDKLYRRYYPLVRNIARHPSGSHDDTEDLIQLTFIRAFQALREFRGESAFSTWLTRISLNIRNSEYRRFSSRQSRFTVSDDPESLLSGEQLYALTETPESTYARKERREAIRSSIRSLPDLYRKPVWLRYVNGNSYREIKQRLGLPIGTVKTHLWRGRQKLVIQLASFVDGAL